MCASALDAYSVYVSTAGFWDVYILKVAMIRANAVQNGRVYVDNNANCVYDPSVDEPLPNRFVRATSGPWLFFTDETGQFTFRTDPATYSIQKIESDGWVVNRSCVSNPTTVTMAAGLNTPAVNFPIDPVASSVSPCDLNVS